MKKNRTDLIFDVLSKKKPGEIPELQHPDDPQPEFQKLFDGIDIDSIKPKKQQIEYASVKIRIELYEEMRKMAESYGIAQPGKFISLVLEKFLKEVKSGQ